MPIGFKIKIKRDFFMAKSLYNTERRINNIKQRFWRRGFTELILISLLQKGLSEKNYKKKEKK